MVKRATAIPPTVINMNAARARKRGGNQEGKAGFVFPGLCADFFELMHHHFRTFVHKPCMCLILNHICDVFGPVDIGSELSGTSWPPLPFGSGASGQGFAAY